MTVFRPTLATLLAMVLACAVQPAPAQQPEAVPDSAESAAVIDSLQAALDRFERAEPPTAADSTRLRRWADSLRAKGDALRGSAPVRARNLLRESLKASRSLADSAGLGSALHDLAVTFYYQSRYEEAVAHYRKALEIFRARGDRQGLAGALGNIGLAYRSQGRYEEALAHHREALKAFREIGDQRGVAYELNNIGIVYRDQGRFEEALVRYRESLDIKRQVGDRQDVAGTLNNIGTIYQSQGRLEEALTRFRESLEIKREVGDRRGIANTLINIGFAYRNQGRYEEALSRFREALEIRREIGERDGIASALENLGAAYYDQDRYEEALSHNRRALEINRDIGNRSGVARSLWTIGELHLSSGRLEPAVDTLGLTVEHLETLRQNATSPEARRSLLSMQIGAYRLLTSAYLRSGLLGSALHSAERGRARLLTDRLAGAVAGDTSFAVSPPSKLRQTLGADEAALLYVNTGSERPLTAMVVTRDSTYAQKLPDSAVRAAIEDEYPTRLSRLRREEGSLTAALGSSPSQEDGTAPSLAETVRLYRYYLTREQSDFSAQKDLSRRLHDLLLEPIAEAIEGKSELITVPTGALGYLPLETLQEGSGRHLIEKKHVRYAQSLTVLRQLRQRNYGERKRPLLALGGAAYTRAETTGSGSLIAEARRGSSRVATSEHASTLLRDADRRMKQGKSPRPTYRQLGYAQWPDLPGTQSEVEQLGTIAGEGATIMTGTGASEDSVRALDERNRLSAYRRVHFATHGVAVPETPKLSALVLSQTNASDSLAARDGYLTMEEIAALEMQADVAVLSACQTGLGKVVAGEGVVSLSHAFLRAGANATLVSQWKVLDESTRQFMTSVYERAKSEGTSFAEAVTETKRAFINGEYGEKNTDPLRWAPFVYYGRE